MWPTMCGHRVRFVKKNIGGSPTRGAAGAEGGGVWEGGVPLPTGEGSGEGAVPPPQKIF